MKKHFIPIFFLLLFSLFGNSSLFATHNRAGEITYRQTGALTIEVKITTYTKVSGQSQFADRPELDIHWGDGSNNTIRRTNGLPDPQGIPFGEMIHPDIKKNEYVFSHTYPGPNSGGQPYIVWMQDPNRNEDILNINGGNSVNIEFYLQTEVFLFPTSIYGFNSSPILLEPPVDFGVVGQIFQHNPNGYDPDGDSVAYELITPQSDVGTPVPGYQPVSDISPGPNNNYSLNVRTGLFTWNSPQQAGLYNIAILVKSYRNGLYLGGIVRDIQIEIVNANNTPPDLQIVEEICVEAGTLIEFNAIATDIDVPAQVCTLTATGGPLLLTNSPATFTDVTGFSPLTSTFRWQTNCDHIRQQPWQIVFKAKDNYFINGGNTDASLATFKVLLIKIIGPPVQNLQSNVVSGQVTLSWDSPYVCDGADGFFGFSVWRKETCDNFEPDSCETGLAGHGYTQINVANLVTTPTGGSYQYIDNTVQPGAIYSYRILGEFATPIPNTNNFHSAISGRSSEELCVQMAQDLPLMTNVDIDVTDVSNGEILVRWTRPRAGELDTIINPPPYQFQLYRSADMNGGAFLVAPIWTSPVYNSYSAMSDTTDFLDLTNLPLNTMDNPYSYRVAFYANGGVNGGDTLGFTSLASSVRLAVNSTDETNILSWTHNVPWTNYKYVVFEETPVGSGTFTVLDTVTTQTYTHRNLNNGQTYCYYVESTGTYGIPDIIDTLINKSQIACGTPLDTLAPCPPVAIASVSGCERLQDDANKEGRGLCEGFILDAENMFNTITWTKPTDTCGNDIARYRVYFAPNCNEQYVLVDEYDLDIDSITHQPSIQNLSGCYYVTAIDSVEGNGGGNESAPSEIVQVDNCPFYELPNVFTPNGDDKNETFHPCLPYRYIIAVDFKVYNKWGQVVFETTDPEINWDGRDKNTGKLVAEDVYFYTCAVQQNCLECPVVKPLKGNIHVIRGGRQ